MRILLAILGLLALHVFAFGAPERVPALRAPAGFEVTLFAGDDLAHDIYSMTTDHRGRIVVASRGWVKILHDTDGDGCADQASTFSTFPKSGAHGMYFDADALVVSGDQGVHRIADRDGDGRADGEPTLLLRTRAGGEHGAHAIAKGPDGWLYLVAGNEAGIGADHVTTPGSPVKDVVAGAFVRFSSDGQQREVLAHGFRNPYDFAFHPLGSILTFESDGERDFHLPWYEGTRVFDVALGAEHGWRLTGSPHAWSRPESWFDNTARLRTIGRGSPSGVVVYRHRAFPARYREGVFLLCWTLGRVYFCPLARAGSTFEAGLETFLESEGENGFAPVDAVVGPEGDLFVAIGGRATRGSVYRVHYTGDVAAPAPNEPLRHVLAADEPLASWSRARWLPEARRLGAAAFEQAATNPALPVMERIRAVEILVEAFAGLRADVARALVADREPELVARAAWALVRSPAYPDSRAMLAALTRDRDPRIARAAWEAWPSLAGRPMIQSPDWYRGLASDDRRVREATVLAARGPEFAAFEATPLPESADERQRIGRLKILVSAAKMSPVDVAPFLDTCAALFLGARMPDTRIDALRLFELGLGDVTPVPGRPETYDGFVAARKGEIPTSTLATLAVRLAPAFPTGDAEIDRELARVLALVAADVAGLPRRIMAKVTATSAVEDDLHFLMAISYLGGVGEGDAAVIAGGVAGLHAKMKAGKKAPSRYWATHVSALFTRLLARDPTLGRALLAAPGFRLPEHSLFAARLPPDEKVAAARLLIDRTLAAGQESWTGEFVELVATLSDDVAFPVLRRAQKLPALRDSVVLALARNPQSEDRACLVEALGSFQPHVVEQAASALAMLEPRATSPEIAAAIGALRRLCQPRRESAARNALANLLEHWSGQRFVIAEGADIFQSYAPWFEWFTGLSGKQADLRDDEPAAWTKRLAQIDWSTGDATRGQRIYEERLCRLCHEGNRIGPSLAGVATRLGRRDLFAEVFDPSRDISPAWQGVEFRLKNGATHVGVVVYESPEATLLQTGPDTTVRVLGEEVASVQPSRTSLMPPGLLNGLSDAQLADFYAHLRIVGR